MASWLTSPIGSFLTSKPHVETGPFDVGDFYGSFGGRYSQPEPWNVYPETSGALNQAMIGSRFGSAAITGANSAWPSFDTFSEGTPGVTLPSGDVIESTGNRGVDLLNRLFGTSPFAGDTPTVDPATGAPTGETVGSDFFGGFDFGSALARVAIVILGFVFVAVGLSMFGSEPIKAAIAKIAQ